MSKFSNALHAVFGFVKSEAPNVEAEAKAIRDKAEADVARLQAKAQNVAHSKAAADLRAAVSLVTSAVEAHAKTIEAAIVAPAGPTGPSA